jgi:hypothetical protein
MDLIKDDQRNSAVLFPFINGEDLNSRPDLSASRWIINFGARTQEEARSYPDCYRQVDQKVRPVLEVNNNAQLRQFWWRYKRPAHALRDAAKSLNRVVVLTLVSRTVAPAIVSYGQVFSHKLCVFASADTAFLALVASAAHYHWVRTYSSTMKSDINYSISDVFETFPLPGLTQQMRELGDRLDTYRRDVMLARQTGLTKTYNLVFDPTVHDEDIVELRRIHKAIDEATVRAYGWDDLLDQLDHGFHSAGRDLRYTIGPAAQREILDRLLELNHERYAEEVRLGLHDKKKGAKKPKVQPQNSDGLF